MKVIQINPKAITKIFIFIMLTSLFLLRTGYASNSQLNIQDTSNVYTIIQNILKLPEEEIDLAYANLIIENALYTSIDIKQELLKIEKLLSIIKAM
ncbi:hypothetical protein MNBD_GAMMA12-2255, partial [hydrothermal vent metagenome]